MGQCGFVHVTQGSSAEFPCVDAMTLEKLLLISYRSYVGVSGGKTVRKGRISRRHFITKPIQISEKILVDIVSFKGPNLHSYNQC